MLLTKKQKNGVVTLYNVCAVPWRISKANRGEGLSKAGVLLREIRSVSLF